MAKAAQVGGFLKREELKKLLIEAIRLKEITRAGWIRAGVKQPESVAAHSWGVAWLVLVLSPKKINRDRAVAIAVLHDLAEVHAGDITPHDGITRKEKNDLEAQAIEELFRNQPELAELHTLWQEYVNGESPEARFVKACDKLDMALQAERYTSIDDSLDLKEFIDSALAKLEGSDLIDLVD